MPETDKPRSGSIAFGADELAESIRKEAATIPTRRAELQAAQRGDEPPISDAELAEKIARATGRIDIPEGEKPRVVQQQPGEQLSPRGNEFKPASPIPLTEIEKLFAKSLDDIKARLHGDIAEIETEIAALKELIDTGTAAAQEHMSGYFGMSHSAQEITSEVRERVGKLRGIVEKL